MPENAYQQRRFIPDKKIVIKAEKAGLLDNIPPSQGSTLHARFIEGKTIKQIAEEQQAPTDSVVGRKRRGIERLAEIMSSGKKYSTELVPKASPSKRKQIDFGPTPQETLKDLYEEQKLSLAEIAGRFGCYPIDVRHALLTNGILLRTKEEGFRIYMKKKKSSEK